MNAFDEQPLSDAPAESDFDMIDFEAGQRSIALNDDQISAVEMVRQKVRERVRVVSASGHAGTGKTTMLGELVAALDSDRVFAVVVTPTNKAATVLRSKGVSAATLYAIFFTLVEVSKNPKKMIFVPNIDRNDDLAPGKLDRAEVIIVDEASMLSSWAKDQLLRMCRTLVLIGDANQLPPVGDNITPRGYFCSLQHDATLTQVMRNDGEVLALANAVRVSPDGKRLAGIDLSEYEPPEAFEQCVVLDRPQFVCWRNVTRWHVNARVRKVLGRTSVLPVPGDLMVCRNNYSDNLLNGTQGELLSFAWDGKKRLALATVDLGTVTEIIEVDMLLFLRDQLPVLARPYSELMEKWQHQDLEEEAAALTYGYAVTAHTAQGGEWPIVCMIDERQGLHQMSEKQHHEDPKRNPPADEVCRRWAYTAVTRAKETVYVASERWMKS